MSKPRTFDFDGVFPSVALGSGDGWMAVREGDPRDPGRVVLYGWSGDDIAHAQEVRQWAVPGGSPAFPNLHIYNGLLWLAYHDGSLLNLRNVTTGTLRQWIALSNPTAFGDRYFAYCEPLPPYQVHRLDLVTNADTYRRDGAPTGLARIESGQVITVDEDRALEGPFTSNPRWAGDLTVYEYDDATRSGAGWEYGNKSGLLWPGLLAFTPDPAVDGARLAIATAGSGSVRLFCGTLAELQAASAQPTPPPPVDPPPIDPPVPPVHTPMKLSNDVKDIRSRYLARFPVPQSAEFPLPPDQVDEHEERCRQWSIRFAEQVAFERLGDGYGVKRADPNRPISKDTLARQLDGRLLIWDLLSGAGTGRPTLVNDPQSQDVTGQTFVTVTPTNHLGAAQPPDPPEEPDPPVEPPPSGLDLSAVLARLQVMEELEQGRHQDVLDSLRSISDAIGKIGHTTPPRYEGKARIFGRSVTFEMVPKP